METKQQIIEEIERLTRVLKSKAPVKQRANIFKGKTFGNVYINEDWAYTTHLEEQEGTDFEGQKKSGHKAMLMLVSSYGTWYNEAGEILEGYLYFKPLYEE